MRREELEHIIRAAADAADDRDIVVVGSQAILGQFPNAPEALLVSREADVFPRNHPERADRIDVALGEGSLFDRSFDYYAHAVGPETAKAPTGWEQRLVPISNDNTGEAVGWCLEAHDLVLAKCAAGRERDWGFVETALEHELVDSEELSRRVVDLPLPRRQIDHVVAMLEPRFDRARRGR